MFKVAKRLEIFEKSIIDDLECKINAAKLRWAKVRILRHKEIAHKELKSSRGEIYKLAKLTPNEFKNLISESYKIINIFACGLGKPRFTLAPVTSADFENLLSDLGGKGG